MLVFKQDCTQQLFSGSNYEAFFFVPKRASIHIRTWISQYKDFNEIIEVLFCSMAIETDYQQTNFLNK